MLKRGCKTYDTLLCSTGRSCSFLRLEIRNNGMLTFVYADLPMSLYLLTYLFTYLLTYLLMPIPPGGALAIYDPSPSDSVLGFSGHSSPVGSLLFQLCFCVSPPTVTRPASLPLPLRVPGQGLACYAGCWLPEGVYDPAPLPPQYLHGHWFLSRSLPQTFIWIL